MRVILAFALGFFLCHILWEIKLDNVRVKTANTMRDIFDDILARTIDPTTRERIEGLRRAVQK